MVESDPVPEKSDVAKREEKILAFWKEQHIFQKSVEKDALNGTFVFYEGPPTANGRPGVHHLESRSFKDAIPRYKTMRGFRVPRRAGWDTHGLPVELQVEKELGFTGKKDIEAYGIAAFNKKCRESVLTYIHEWQRFTERVGYWVDQSTAYFTYDAPYMETLWWILKQIANDDRLFKDYKVVPWCARCGTALSSHELAQGYQDVKDLTITAKFALTDEPDTHVLAWTTTPWTLPGNVGLAVGKGIEYGLYEKDGEKVIVAASRAETVLKEGWKQVRTFPGSELVGKSYEPLYPFAKGIASEREQQKFENAFKIYPADFVTIEDGTGIVHTAVMYGQEDFELGTAVGLPKVHLVGADGKFATGTDFLEGRSVTDDELSVDIVKDLAGRGLLFDKSKYEHSYPFCWRCGTRLIYYARDSWYIRMHDLRETLVAENQKVNWEPEYIREGRMGEWLANAKDWAISRERYWGTPLPVWESADGTERVVVGSIEELKTRTKKSGNTYCLMRHGEAEQNVLGIVSSNGEDNYGLTELGKAQIEETVKELSGITCIYSSPFRRARESAELAADKLGISREAIHYDPRIGELDFGTLDGGTYKEFLAYRREHLTQYEDSTPDGESYLDARKRFGSFIYELERTHQNEHILIVTHGIAFESLLMVVEGTSKAESKKFIDEFKPEYAQLKKLDFVPIPHNEDYELDLHRPYIDDVALLSDSGAELTRVKEVIDVWFDSGAMPFAQDHYPFQNKEAFDASGYPADYIAEAIDQTRGWFYTLLAVGTLLKRGRAYKNVICLGHILDAAGKKMSKSKGNVIEPFAAIDAWGVDTLRFWMYSVNQPGDSKNFDEKTLKEADRVISWFENSVKFYELFKEEASSGKEQIIDTWMQTRVNETIYVATDAFEKYNLYGAARNIGLLVEDLSQWYVRRVRDRVRDGDSAALATLRSTIKSTSLLLAPLTPFIAEWGYQKVRGVEDPESVHLADWPNVGPVDHKLSADMESLRAFASEGLRVRQAAGIRVRQPLALLSLSGEFSPELCQLLAEEVNVKEVRIHASKTEFDLTLTPELVREGNVREFARALADARKVMGLSPKDRVHVFVEANGEKILAHETLVGTTSVTFDLKPEEGTNSVELSTGKIAFSVQLDAS